MLAMVSQCLSPTEMVYMTYEGNWQMECSSTVLQVNTNEQDPKQSLDLVLDRSVLHAQGGGQPTDTGRIVSEDGLVDVHVTKVTMDRDTGIAHHTGSSATSSSRIPNAGDNVKVMVDEENRRILSECHTAGHVVDAAMERCGKLFKPSKAYHFLDSPYVEYAGSIPVEEREEALIKLQTAFLELVQEDIATKIDVVSKEKADEMCNRIAQNFDVDVFADAKDQVRVVTVANFPCPCGGTHVRSTGDLAKNGWGVTGIKSKKGVLRIKYGIS